MHSISIEKPCDIGEWPNNMSNAEYLETVFGPSLYIDDLSFRQKMKKILTSHYLHFVIIILVLLDSLCVTVELIMSFEKNEENHALVLVEHIFKYLGLSILSLFLFELCLKIIFINKDLLKSKLEIFDAIIIVVSFIIGNLYWLII